MSVRLLHLNKRFGKQQVLSDVSLSINDGEIVGLLGPNGAGKSTMMKIMAGLWQPDACAETRVEVPQRVGYLPEQNPLYDDMYVREYLLFMARLTMPKVSSAQRQTEVEQLIERVGLTPEVHKPIRVLSKGYRQRVGLAQAQLGDPQLLILDEPTTGLDPNQLVDIRALIRQLGQNRTVILSTHILSEVQEICDRVVILDHGVIRADKHLSEIDNLEQLFHASTQLIDNR